MPKRRVKALPLPAPGSAFLMQLENGQFGVCRVLRESTPEERKEHGCACVLVVASPWIGPAPPDLKDPQLREFHRLTHHNWKGQPNLSWVSDPPDATYQLLGFIEPSPADLQQECYTSGGWSFGFQVCRQWQWDTDHAGVLQADAAQAEAQRRAGEEAARLRRAAAPPTLASLRAKRRFEGWKDLVPAKARAACRKLFRETIDKLLALEPAASDEQRLGILKASIERLNELDDQYDHFIETTCREDLCEAFQEITEASGLQDCADLADRWREW